ncbi:MAG: transpeptidase family protein [Candidatus Marinimicrobia bacterium]|nr:transpeptidase family protein [Candidatus Neomarinimicrobiota bacterium]
MNSLYSQYRIRIQFLVAIVGVISLALLGKIFSIQVVHGNAHGIEAIHTTIVHRTEEGNRGTIYDRNGIELAQTIKKYDFWVNTNDAFDKDRIISLFSKTFNEPPSKFIDLLSRNKNYVSLKRNIPAPMAKPIMDEIRYIDGLKVDASIKRYYPQHHLASQVIGYVDQNNSGQFGIESQFNTDLQGSKGRVAFNRSASGKLTRAMTVKQPIISQGNNIELTLDVELQSILQSELKKSVLRTTAKTANGIILDPHTGEILAMATYPDFDPNEYQKFPIESYKNRAIADAYEPGSTYKIINTAAALESGVIAASDTFFCENGEYKLPRGKIVHDHEPHENMSVEDIFVHSSNIGIMKMAEILGDEIIYDTSRKFGFGMTSGIRLPGETPGKLRTLKQWSGISGRMVSIGQEIASSTLQIAMAYSTIANGGFMVKPHIVKSVGDSNVEGNYPKVLRQIISSETSEELLAMLEKVVVTGTGTKASIPGFRVGGKTGTAEKFINGSYSKSEFISSFASIFPVDNPKYVCVVSVDSPKYGYHWGNETAAPVVRGVYSRIINDKEDPLPFDDWRDPVQIEEEPLLAVATETVKSSLPLLSTKHVQKTSNREQLPDFRGKTLKQAIRVAKDLGININPVGYMGRVVWQSPRPGTDLKSCHSCTIKLESNS